MRLFEDNWGEDNSPIDDPEITQVIFYYGKEEAILFKKLCKEGMKVEFPDYIKDGNVTDLVLKILKEKYEHLLPQKMLNASASGSVESNLPG